MSDTRELTVVMAPSYPQFREWCRIHGMGPHDRRVLRVCDWRDAEKMRGLLGPRRGGAAKLAFTGHPRDLDGYDLIRETALLCGFDWPLDD